MEVQWAPLRPWDDFVSGSARFSRPDFNDLAKWNNRVVSNLLYYQSNYFIMVVTVLLLVGFMQPLQMILGGAVVVLVFTGSLLVSENKAVVGNFKRQYPTCFVLLVLVASHLFMSLFGGVMVFVFGIALPLVMIFIHSSLRLRNLKNKLENKMEGIGLKKTPMGILVDALGQEENITKFADILAGRSKD